jgi:spectinomycin phosphotransferase
VEVRAAPPEELETSVLIDFLADGWGFEVEAIQYAAVGGGSYHWVVEDRDGSRGFVTGDDLDRKPWLGETRDSVFDNLVGAFATAVALHDSGLDFVVAPTPTRRGETLARIGPRHTVALFPFVAGQPGTFGRYENAEREALLTMLGDLHRATPEVASVAHSIDLDLTGRGRLEAALRELDQPWAGGPLSELTRQTLARHSSYVAELLALGDRLSAEVARRSTKWVVTHGEPHGGNVMHTGAGHVLVDWDTVALAPPERDLWMLVEDDGEEATIYVEATGHELDEVAVNFFRLRWDLDDIVAFTDELRSPHQQNKDSEKAYDALTFYLGSRDRWAALLE